MIFVTGDIHSNPVRLNSDSFPEGKSLTKDDYVIICGDFGLIWNYAGEDGTERYWLNWLESKPWTTLFVDGNHENFDRLYSYSIKDFCGGKVHEIRPSILHLMRGEVFILQEKKFFTFGGASSHDIRDGILEPGDARIYKWRRDYDKLYRVNHHTWWKEEMPTKEEMQHGVENLLKFGEVDFIISHCTSTGVQDILSGGRFKRDNLTDYFEEIYYLVPYKKWIFGHYHINENVTEKDICIYEQIIRIV